MPGTLPDLYVLRVVHVEALLCSTVVLFNNQWYYYSQFIKKIGTQRSWAASPKSFILDVVDPGFESSLSGC